MIDKILADATSEIMSINFFAMNQDSPPSKVYKILEQLKEKFTSPNNRSKEISLACNKLLSLRGQLSSQLTLAQYEDIGAVVAKLLAVR